ncbi:Glucose-inhibited division family A protein isoform 1 [Hibiscus syriacus]|uniref:Glucose-inhibited division family A protein isoform 1 n=1 Tax=Hibiscus syriacus TaxID=106335 RepID=A0A6A2ZTS3_HIBSY|nr:Glucose-inhibited division family A protein isoform 1 [Hibiscus syriacus]
MPESDPFILFICIVVGGGCLLTYMLTSHSDNLILLPALGFSLVCMPWIFWIVTVLYRLMSKFFGFRMVIGSLYGDDSGNANAKTSSPLGTTSGVDDIGGGAQIVDANGESPPNSHEIM